MTQPENGGTHRLPYFLPDGRHVLFVSIKADSKPEGILSLDRSTKQTEVVTVESTDGRYAAPGYLLFLHGNTLLAQSFDAAGRRTTGSPSVVAEGVISFVNRFTGQYSAIDAGLLVYQPSAVAPTRQLTLFGADGARLGTIGDPAVFSGHVFISPDGRQAAAVLQETGGRSAVWIYDLATGVPTRLAFGGLEPIAVAWAPDGKALAYTSNETGIYEVFVMPLPKTGAKLQVTSGGGEHPQWISGGRELAYINPQRELVAVEMTRNGDQLTIGRSRKLFGGRPLPAQPGNEGDREGASPVYISPDGTRILLAVPTNLDAVVPLTLGGGSLRA